MFQRLVSGTLEREMENIMKFWQKVMAVVIIIVITGLFAWGLAPRRELFTASEYEEVETRLLSDATLKEDPSSEEGGKQLEATQYVTMTGRLYGERGEVYYLDAEVRLDNGDIGWVPLNILTAAHGY